MKVQCQRHVLFLQQPKYVLQSNNCNTNFSLCTLVKLKSRSLLKFILFWLREERLFLTSDTRTGKNNWKKNIRISPCQRSVKTVVGQGCWLYKVNETIILRQQNREISYKNVFPMEIDCCSQEQSITSDIPKNTCTKQRASCLCLQGDK